MSRALGAAMRRRQFIKGLAGSAIAWPVTGRAQQSKPRIGLVSIGADPSNPVLFIPFLQQMRELGYVEGGNIAFEKRFAAGNIEFINDFVADLVQRRNNSTVGGRSQRRFIKHHHWRQKH
jgi:putative ABC transport system substrate-binding protein